MTSTPGAERNMLDHRTGADAESAVVAAATQDPRRRATADQVLQHPWMRENGTASSAPLDNIILKRMQAGTWLDATAVSPAVR